MTPPPPPSGLLSAFIRFFLDQKLVVGLLLAGIVLWGVAVAPFDWDLRGFPRHPVPVDALPNLGENQQIVFTEWPGRSPQDVENQVTYPLASALMGVPGVREVRSTSMFGASLVFLIFDDDVEFYWSRARILEKLNSLPAGLLPADAQPALGPDATALGQVFWYTLEGRDPDGKATGGWDLHELRSVQDWTVRQALLAAEGISEVASIGGFVREYQVDVDPDALRAHGATVGQVVEAVRRSNLDIGARVMEINRVEYVLRGVGFIRDVADIEQATVRAGPDGLPIRVRDVATVGLGPAQRRGALTKMGAEAVGGVVVVREGYNPLEAIRNVKAKIDEIRPGLPSRAVVDWSHTDRAALAAFGAREGFEPFSDDGLNQEAWQAWLRTHPRADWPPGVVLSRLDIVSFYDRSGLIGETLNTLNNSLVQQVLITVIVILLLVMHFGVAALISLMLPLAILICFIFMKHAGVDSNLVSLGGIAIAIGAIVDMGIILTENVVKHLGEAAPDEPRRDVVFRGAREVASAMLTAIATTVVGFLPVFTMTGAEGKLFTPLAFTWTFVLFSSILIALAILPAAVHLLIARRRSTAPRPWLDRLPSAVRGAFPRLATGVALAVVAVLLARVWEPLGAGRGPLRNLVFTVLVIGMPMGGFWLVLRFYRHLLGWALAHKAAYLAMPLFLLLAGASVWLGFDRVFGFLPASLETIGLDARILRHSRPWVWAAHEFPGLGREFMPPLDEGTFLWMPTTMPHASLGEVLEVMQYQDQAIASVPEVDLVVGKLGRAESALDPAPISMIESVIHYKTEYALDESGRRVRFRYDRKIREFVRDERGELIPDRRGRPFRQWRDSIRTPDDIWNEIVKAAAIPGTTSAPKLQPIETRQVMLQTGMRAPMGLKLRAPNLDVLDRMAVELERHLRQAPGVRAETVNAERVAGKPYLEIAIDREAISRYGLNVVDVQEALAAAAGGMAVTTTVEGRERYPVRVRYQRELRDDIEAIERILIHAADGTPVPLADLAEIRYERGPDMIRGEDTFLTAYVTFGGQPGLAEVDVVEGAQAYLAAMIERGELAVPPGTSWRFAGSYENQQRAMATLRVVLPLSLGIIFLILYFQFHSVSTVLVLFSSIMVAWASGFFMLYLYGQGWFMDFAVFGVNLRELFHLHPVNLSVAVWVGFLALFGIAVDDGVVMHTYIEQRLAADRPRTRADVRASVLEAGLRRIRPCLMTTATTFLALLPVLTSTGRGADLLLPMALPIIGGISLGVFDWFTVPVLASWLEERRVAKSDASRPG
jgi:copper/silver efflux system protein